ncbi:protein NO VEIN domain-containing protein [Saccharothrix lopnurensis]|uniref:Protein NO VEIN domain-containing protein n=1 Tax=Saccharothrix lopnurensis TaxID=1670621 RepID=A0ABW1P3Z4_9PSEU
MPSDEVLEADLRFMVSLLGRLYALGAPSPEVEEAVSAVARAAGRRGTGSGQGFGLSHAERLAVEAHSVAMACDHLRAQGYEVRDVGARESYDLDATRGDEHLFVEVKGTTSAGAEVVLTHNEVLLNAEHHPDTMLIVVAGVELDRAAVPPTAGGGVLRVAHPWSVDPADLTPVAYRYRLR